VPGSAGMSKKPLGMNLEGDDADDLDRLVRPQKQIDRKLAH